MLVRINNPVWTSGTFTPGLFMWFSLRMMKSLVVVHCSFGDAALVNFSSGGEKLGCFLLHASSQGFLFVQFFLCGIVAYVLSYLHRTEVRATHRAEVGKLCALLRKRFVVVFARDFRVKRKVELILPTEFKSGFGQCVVAVLGSGMALGQV